MTFQDAKKYGESDPVFFYACETRLSDKVYLKYAKKSGVINEPGEKVIKEILKEKRHLKRKGDDKGKMTYGEQTQLRQELKV